MEAAGALGKWRWVTAMWVGTWVVAGQGGVTLKNLTDLIRGKYRLVEI